MLAIDLRNHIAVVTGASGELGRVIARTLAAAGADVALTFLNNAGPAHRLAEEIQAAGRRAIAVRADITSQESVFELQKAVTLGLGDASIVVTNAVAQIFPWKTVLETEVADYDSQYRSCVVHNLLMAKAFVPAMIRRNAGRIIAINTECAMQNSATQSAYVSGKRGMDGLLRVLAKEVGPHQITVNQVAPGWMISDKHRASGEEKQPAYEANVPLRRRGTDQDVANMVAFLASDLAGFVSGAFIPVSGGTVMPAI